MRLPTAQDEQLEATVDTISFISQCLAQVQMRLMGSCKDLTQENVLWRPSPQSNNIGFILWHVARGEDRTTTSLAGRATDLWESDGWYRAFGHPLDAPEPADRPGLRSLAMPNVQMLVGYLDAVYGRTRQYMSALAPEELGAVPNPSEPARTVASMLRHLITHKNNHHGQIDYLRGLQDERWDLTPGLGVVLPDDDYRAES